MDVSYNERAASARRLFLSRGWQAIANLHRLLLTEAFYPLLLGSLATLLLIALRAYLLHSRGYVFLLWNLFLAWVPYGVSFCILVLHRQDRSRFCRLIIPGLLWLLFFPNAPYIVTDFVHFQRPQPIPWWYDLGIILTCAWTGCFLAVTSLHMMQAVVRDYLGAAGSWLFVLCTVALSGLGIYVGRFLRWNSWDLLMDPQQILFDVATRLLHPNHHPRTLGVTLLFGGFLLMCYLVFTTTRRPGAAMSAEAN